MPTVTGTKSDDTITPTTVSGGIFDTPCNAADSIVGLGGNDELFGGGDNDTLLGGTGDALF